MDEDEVVLVRIGARIGGRLGQGLALMNHLGAPAGRARDLGGRREGRHHDHRADTKEGSVPGHRLSVIACGHGDDTSLTLLGCEQREAVGRATLIEGARDLQGAKLQSDLGSDQPTESVTVDGRCPLDLIGNAPRRFPDVLEADHSLL
jgi:hypothetical protein